MFPRPTPSFRRSGRAAPDAVVDDGAAHACREAHGGQGDLFVEGFPAVVADLAGGEEGRESCVEGLADGKGLLGLLILKFGHPGEAL